MSNKRQGLLILHEHLGSHPGFDWACDAHPFSFLFVFCLSSSCVLCAQCCYCPFFIAPHLYSLDRALLLMTKLNFGSFTVAIMNWLIATEFCLKDDGGSVYTGHFSAFVIFTDTPPSVARCYPHVFDGSAFLFSFFLCHSFTLYHVFVLLFLYTFFSFFFSIISSY